MLWKFTVAEYAFFIYIKLWGFTKVSYTIADGNNIIIKNHAIKTIKMTKKTIRTPKALAISHRLDETDLKYFNNSVWAASTFISASSTLESILKIN